MVRKRQMAKEDADGDMFSLKYVFSPQPFVPAISGSLVAFTEESVFGCVCGMCRLCTDTFNLYTPCTDGNARSTQEVSISFMLLKTLLF